VVILRNNLGLFLRLPSIRGPAGYSVVRMGLKLKQIARNGFSMVFGTYMGEQNHIIKIDQNPISGKFLNSGPKNNGRKKFN